MTDRNAFHKGEALGNDYIVVHRQRFVPLDAFAVRLLCDRHHGIGGDGIIELVAIEGDGATAIVWNADGSTAEVSGNGLRIAARALASAGISIASMSSAGRTYPIEIDDDGVAITLPPARVTPSATVDDVAGRPVDVTEVDVGNPHVVVSSRDTAPDDWTAVAAALSTHARWPKGVNVERVDVSDEATIALTIHERGVGPTSASGSGACAAVAAAVANGWVTATTVTARMPGGNVRVAVRSDGLRLDGPVTLTYEGRLSSALVRSVGYR